MTKADIISIVIAVVLAIALIVTIAVPKTVKVSFVLPDGQTVEAPEDGNDAPVDNNDAANPTPAPAPETPENADTENPATPDTPAQDQTPSDNSTAVEEPAPGKGLNSTDPAKVAAFYSHSRKITKAPKGHQQMILANNGKIEGGGLVGTFAKLGGPIVDSVLKKNSTETTWIPGDVCNDILPTDLTKSVAKTTADGKYTEVEMAFKGQVDGPDGDNKNGGPVARGIGTLGSVNDAVSQLGAEFKEGRENIKLTYSDAWLKCKINNETGMIENGTWHYIVMLNISSAKVTFVGITGSAKDVVAGVDFTVTI